MRAVGNLTWTSEKVIPGTEIVNVGTLAKSISRKSYWHMQGLTL